MYVDPDLVRRAIALIDGAGDMFAMDPGETWNKETKEVLALLTLELPPDCWCHVCDSEYRQRLMEAGQIHRALSRHFIVCPDCGNKRCPKATHHDNKCTGSNDSGQAGSVYGGIPLPSENPRYGTFT